MDKLSMSLDDIIKHNRKNGRQQKFNANRNPNAIKKEPIQQQQQQQRRGNNQFQKPKFNQNKNKNVNNNRQSFGILNRSKVIKKRRIGNSNSAVRIANNANGAIGNRGRNKQQQLNKFRLQRRRDNQNLTKSQVKAKFVQNGNSAAVAPTVPKTTFKRSQNFLNRIGKVGTAGRVLKQSKLHKSSGILKSNKIQLQNRFKKLGKKFPGGGVARVRFNKALGQRKNATVLQQPQHKLLQKKASIHQQTARKNVIKAKRLLNARKGQPLLQKARFAPISKIQKSTIRKNKFVVKKPVVKLTSQLNSNLLRINIKNNQMLQKVAQRSQQQPKSTKPIIKRNWRSNQAASVTNRKF